MDFEKALHYACTDLSRLTAQLWHECGVQKYDQEYCISRVTFMEIYKLLTSMHSSSNLTFFLNRTGYHLITQHCLPLTGISSVLL